MIIRLFLGKKKIKGDSKVEELRGNARLFFAVI